MCIFCEIQEIEQNKDGFQKAIEIKKIKEKEIQKHVEKFKKQITEKYEEMLKDNKIALHVEVKIKAIDMEELIEKVFNN